MYSGTVGISFPADDVGQRLADVRQHTAGTAAQNKSSGLLAGSASQQMLNRYWQHQQLMQLRNELTAVDSRIAHLRILMDLARSVCDSLALLDPLLILFISCI